MTAALARSLRDLWHTVFTFFVFISSHNGEYRIYHPHISLPYVGVLHEYQRLHYNLLGEFNVCVYRYNVTSISNFTIFRQNREKNINFTKN